MKQNTEADETVTKYNAEQTHLYNIFKWNAWGKKSVPVVMVQWDMHDGKL
jgi:hypothetical protein